MDLKDGALTKDITGSNPEVLYVDRTFTQQDIDDGKIKYTPKIPSLFFSRRVCNGHRENS